MNKKGLSLLLCFLIAKLGAYQVQDSRPEPFALFTVPKAGSHLLIKTLHFMTGFTPAWHTTSPSLAEWYNQSQFPYTHCVLSESLLTYYSNSPVKQILGIRDLRDVSVSIVHQILKGTWPEFTNFPQKLAAFKELDFDQQLLFVIEQEYELQPPKINLQLGLQKVAHQAVYLSSNPAILICRYEDLIGVEGGGEREKQLQTLRKIANHIGVFFSDNEIESLALHLYGNTDNPFGKKDFKDYQSTFREGKIGAWKSFFKPMHKDAFKRRLGQALIDLGYEQDNNW